MGSVRGVGMSAVNLEAREAICTFVAWFLDAHDYAPSLREIAAGVRMSDGGTYHHLMVLRAERRLDWLDGQPRTYHLVRPPL